MLHFVLACAGLAAGAIYLHAAESRGTLRRIKKPLPIRKPLRDFDRSVLLPYQVIHAERLPPEVETDLGTTEYLNWVLGNEQAANPRMRTVNISVTYYTGIQDQVPHVPEECMQQADYSPDRDDTLTMAPAGVGEGLRVRRLTFIPPPSEIERGANGKTVVYYTIRVNSAFEAGRDQVRFRMAAPWDSHLYYSKVEVTYREAGDADLPALDQAAGDMLGRLIRELQSSHWPPPGAERGESNAKASDGG